MWRNPEFCSAQGICGQTGVSGRTWWHAGGPTNPGRYIILRSVEKSVAVSEDAIRGQPLGASAVARLVWTNIRRSAGEWNERTLVWTRKRSEERRVGKECQ